MKKTKTTVAVLVVALAAVSTGAQQQRRGGVRNGFAVDRPMTPTEQNIAWTNAMVAEALRAAELSNAVVSAKSAQAANAKLDAERAKSDELLARAAKAEVGK